MDSVTPLQALQATNPAFGVTLERRQDDTVHVLSVAVMTPTLTAAITATFFAWEGCSCQFADAQRLPCTCLSAVCSGEFLTACSGA